MPSVNDRKMIKSLIELMIKTRISTYHFSIICYHALTGSVTKPVSPDGEVEQISMFDAEHEKRSHSSGFVQVVGIIIHLQRRGISYVSEAQ